VRPSIAQPELYEDVNVRGTQSVLDYALSRRVPRFVFASSSSVYGVNPRTPWHEDDADLRPISPYATTKLAAECLGRATAHASDTQFVSLRFFTVYGPRQRPDLAIHTFTRNILDGRPIAVFGDGTTMRDYTYVDDIVAGVRSAMTDGGSTSETFNLGNDRPVSLMQLIGALQALLGRRAKLEYRPLPAGDVRSTWAAIDRARTELGYEPSTSLETGLARFAEWLISREVRAA
jgi:UDP-glucuronate 4-epimerase